MIVGTSNFVSPEAAVEYYRPMRFTRADIDRKIAEKEIIVGRPDIKPGQRLIVIDGATRYAIEDVA
jgi:hypothetical protein